MGNDPIESQGAPPIGAPGNGLSPQVACGRAEERTKAFQITGELSVQRVGADSFC